MARFTQEQIEQLRQSPHIALVSESTILFKPEFKLYLLEQKRLGRRMRDVLRESGIDPDILGAKRIENLSHRLNRDAKEGNCFADGRKTNGRTVPPEVGEMSLEEGFRWILHELEYTKQEVEFLKKLQMANMEARKEWESKHRPK